MKNYIFPSCPLSKRKKCATFVSEKDPSDSSRSNLSILQESQVQ